MILVKYSNNIPRRLKRHLKATAHNNAARAFWLPDDGRSTHPNTELATRVAPYLRTSGGKSTVDGGRTKLLSSREIVAVFIYRLEENRPLFKKKKTALVRIAFAWRDVTFSVSHGEYWQAWLAAAASRWSQRPITSQSDVQWKRQGKKATILGHRNWWWIIRPGICSAVTS